MHTAHLTSQYMYYLSSSSILCLNELILRLEYSVKLHLIVNILYLNASQ